MSGEVWGDASAALGIINRKGLGKTRHIETGLLWIQQTAAERHLKYAKILGKLNPADLFTKYLDTHTIDGHLRRLAFEITAGRALEAPKLHVVINPRTTQKHIEKSCVAAWNRLLKHCRTTKVQGGTRKQRKTKDLRESGRKPAVKITSKCLCWENKPEKVHVATRVIIIIIKTTTNTKTGTKEERFKHQPKIIV